MDEAHSINQEIIRLANNHTLGWVLQNRDVQRTLVVPRQTKASQKSKTKQKIFPIRDEAHLKIVEASFLAKAARLTKKERGVVSKELELYLGAEFRLLQYKQVAKQVVVS